MRWALVLAIAVPIALAVVFLFARLGGNQDLARTCVRGLRFLMTAELTLLVLLALIGFAYERRGRQQDAAQFYPPGKLIDIGGYRLQLYCTGSGGPTVILEHGHRATYVDWFRVQPQIAKFTRVCSYDRAGYGWSDPSSKERVPSVMVDELRSLLRAAGEKPPYIVIGHSFGAMNAVMFAHKFPGETAGVILVDGSTPQSLQRAAWHTKVWFRMMQLTTPFGLPRWRGWCRGGPQEISDVKQMLTCRSQNFDTILKEDAAFPQTADEVRAITSLGNVPLVVIVRDPASGLDSQAETRHDQQQREVLRLSTNSRLMVAEGSGHDVPLARPDVIVDAVKALLTPQVQAGSRGTP